MPVSDRTPPHFSMLVETKDLEEWLQQPDIRILDASWHMKMAKRAAHDEYLSVHIPGAVRFDVDTIADPLSHLPHTAPTPELFAQSVTSLGIGDRTHVVIYDADGVSTAACRAWWMFRLFGHDRVSVLNGGLPKWRSEGRPVAWGEVEAERNGIFTPSFHPNRICNAEQIIANLDSQAVQVVDVRSAARFYGKVPEPWPVDKIGHIPGSLNLPFIDLIDAETGCFRPVEHLKQSFDAAGLTREHPVIVSCGSGITACVTAFSLELTGSPPAIVYDGSWVDWGTRKDTPVEK